MLQRFIQDKNALSLNEKQELAGYLNIYGAVWGKQAVDDLIKNGSPLPEFPFALTTDERSSIGFVSARSQAAAKETTYLAKAIAYLTTERDISKNEQLFQDAQGIAKINEVQRGQAEIGTPALSVLTGPIGTGVRVAGIAAGSFQAGLGGAQIVDGEFTEGASNLGLGVLAVFGNVGAQVLVGGGKGVAASPSLRGTESIAKVDVAAGPVNFMGGRDQFFKNASKRSDIDPNGTFDVVAHGSTQQIEVFTPNGPLLVNHRVAAKLIEDSPGYNGQPIRLLSCDTGACSTGFAQNLANKIGLPVQAPTNLVWAYGDGKLVVAPRQSANPNSSLYNLPDLSKQGTFRTFIPGKP